MSVGVLLTVFAVVFVVELPDKTMGATSALRIAAISFGVLLVAEFGDGSQLATAAMAARHGAPLSVFAGAWLGELAVCTIGALAGRALLRVLPVRWVQRAAALVFTAFAALAVAEIVRG